MFKNFNFENKIIFFLNKKKKTSKQDKTISKNEEKQKFSLIIKQFENILFSIEFIFKKSRQKLQSQINYIHL